MKLLNRILILPLALSVQLILFPVAASADAWAPPQVGSPGNYGFSVADGSLITGNSILSAMSKSTVDPTGPSQQILCNGGYTATGPCKFDSPGTTLNGQVFLPVCITSTQTNCLDTMSIGTSASTMVKSTYVSMTDGPKVVGDPVRGLPDGSTTGLWTNPTLNSGGTSTYATNLMLNVGFSNGHYVLSDFNAVVLPYKTITGNPQFYKAPQDLQTAYNNGTPMTGEQGGYPGCAWTAEGVCGRIQDFSSGTVVSMTIRLSSSIGGWFKARMQGPSISVSKFDSTSNLITVSGQSVDVPAITFETPVVGADSATSKFFSFVNLSATNPSGWIFFSDQAQALSAVNYVRTYIKDTSSGSVNMWSFGSIPATGNACLTNTSAVLGVVSTNAMVYNSSFPAFSNGTLSYQVAGMHYMTDGTLTNGIYDMVMSDSVAICMYKFTNAPISGSVSITSDSSGGQNVATTSVSDIGGWVHLAAYNFQFSNPVITVKLTQESQPSVIVAPPAKTTITCVNIKNKKLIKKITAVKPVCPSGFKKV